MTIKLPVEFDRDWSAKARVVHIGVTPNDDRYYGSEVEVVGPIDAALEKLCAATGGPCVVVASEHDQLRGVSAPVRSAHVDEGCDDGRWAARTGLIRGLEGLV